jgi:hypothetical protein
VQQRKERYNRVKDSKKYVMYYIFDKNRKIISERKNIVKITNELRSYVDRVVDARVAPPASNEIYDQFIKDVTEVQNKFKDVVKECIDKYIAALKEIPELKECTFDVGRYGVRFSVDYGETEIYRTYTEECEQRRDRQNEPSWHSALRRGENRRNDGDREESIFR